MSFSKLFVSPELKLHLNNKSKRFFITIKTERGYTSAIPVDKDTARAIMFLHKGITFSEEFNVFSII
jgi:hypothetical protein